jgi:PTH1 family peptidyl-tRNA hydrolase
VGFLLLDALARDVGCTEWKGLCDSSVCETEFAGERLVLAKPMTYMNLSGGAVALLLTEFGFAPADLMLVFDDLSLPLGRIRLRHGGSSAGHRGVESVRQTLQTTEFVRLRLGIGEPEMPLDKAGFVLAEFSPEQRQQVDEMILRAVGAVRMLLDDGLPKAMSIFNARQ